ncbi:MAG: GAF domain-containing protein [Alkalispirochaetaceae bacterium]
MANVNGAALLKECRGILEGTKDNGTALQRIATYLQSEVEHYNWFGFYLTVPGSRTLALGPYEGAPTDHLRIPFGRGVCGQAAEREETVVVDDVSAESNYLACSLETKSEIVVPIMRGERVLGEIDIDSHRKAAFDESDRGFLEELAGLLKDRLPEIA